MTSEKNAPGTGIEASRPATEDATVAAGAEQTGLSTEEATRLLRRDGPNDVPDKRTNLALTFARKFWGPSAWMLELIAVLSFVLHKQADFWITLALLVLNALLSFLEEERASTAVAALRQRLHVTARVLRDTTWRVVAATELVSGDIIRIRSGDFVPADVRLLGGSLKVDQSALTGESQELERNAADTLFSGSIVRHGEATATVIATGIRTYYGRTTQLVAGARPKLHVEEVISRVVKGLFVIVGIMVATAIVVSLSEGLHLLDILPLALILLMSAIPVALPVMFTVSMALGSVELGREGVFVTRLNAAEDAANMDVLCADKTGTLTTNRLSLVKVLPQPGFTEDDVVRCGAFASNESNQDPIDLAFLRRARELKLLAESDKTLAFTPFTPATRRTQAVIERQGHSLYVMKGALRTIAAAAAVPDDTIEAIEQQIADDTRTGVRALAVAVASDDKPLCLAGVALLRDALRPDSRSLVEDLRNLGVSVKMLTGDALPIAQQIGHSLGLSKILRATEFHVARITAGVEPIQMVERFDGFSDVYPEDKFAVVKTLQAGGHVVGMTGDGVNDAPALRQAEVGIAVSGATDVAKSAASVVLAEEGLLGILSLVKVGRSIYQRVLTWIVNKTSRTILKSGFVVVAFLVTGRFVISALGMMLLVFMTDFVKIALSTDNVRPSPRPETWNIDPLVRIGGILGVLMLFEALGLLAVAWQGFGLSQHPRATQTFTFQTLLFFALFSIISIRERRSFWKSRPSAMLLAALSVDGAAGVLIGLYGLVELRPLPAAQTAIVIGYSLVCSLFLNDFVKTVLCRRLETVGRDRPH